MNTSSGKGLHVSLKGDLQKSGHALRLTCFSPLRCMGYSHSSFPDPFVPSTEWTLKHETNGMLRFFNMQIHLTQFRCPPPPLTVHAFNTHLLQVMRELYKVTNGSQVLTILGIVLQSVNSKTIH